VRLALRDPPQAAPVRNWLVGWTKLAEGERGPIIFMDVGVVRIRLALADTKKSENHHQRDVGAILP
jgi:hypothetical protein